jgi:GT2 family glycosyltransferase
MPFAGTAGEAREALRTLLGLELREGDELIVADNSGTVPETPGVRIVSALAERSPAHARNAGADRATADWILFLDADCHPREGLLDAYFASPVDPEVGALAGGVMAAPDPGTLAARYGAARNFLSQEAHLAHPYRPRAVAANLLVRGAAFEQLGGFYEGLRAAEDTDFSWRLQEAGWRLEVCPQASVEHRYRATIPELRHQWRGYAAGRAWLARRYQGFTPEPAVLRASKRVWRRSRGGEAPTREAPTRGAPTVGVPTVGAPTVEAPTRGAPPIGPGPPTGTAPTGPPPTPTPPTTRAYLALDVLLALEELAGFALSNRPARDRVPARGETGVVLIADRFPARGDPLVDAALRRPGVRVEAIARPDAVDRRAALGLPIEYREDEGIAARASALAELVLRHPVRSTQDLLARKPGEPGLSALAPAVLRLERSAPAPVHALGGRELQSTARRLAALAGTSLASSSSLPSSSSSSPSSSPPPPPPPLAPESS